MQAHDVTPPSLANVEAEAVLLGAAMFDNATIDRAADLIGPDDFSLPIHGRIWAALARERDAGRHASAIAVRGYFEGDADLAALGGIAYLARLTGDTSGALIPARELAGQIRGLAHRRRVRAGLLSTADRCTDLESPMVEIVGEVDEIIRAPADMSARHATAGEAMDALIASLDEPSAGVSCGIIPELDGLLGYLRPGSVTIVAGRPGMGKTLAALSYARGAAEAGYGVQFFSLEMGATELSGRMAADMSFDLPAHDRVPYRAIQDRKLSREQRDMVSDAARHLHGLPLSIVDTGSLTIGGLRRAVRSQKRRLAATGRKLDLVMVDYLQLVRPDRPTSSPYDAVSEVSRGLKALAMDEGVALIALAQLSRSVEQRADKRPILSDLRDSGQIEQDADNVLFLLRPEYYLKDSEPADHTSDEHAAWSDKVRRVQGVIEFILAKRRNGSTGNAFGRFYGAYQAVRGAE